MGEYIEDGIMGCSIILYYGSFVHLLEDSSREWEEELWDIIVHELRHHLESLAGVDDLVRKRWPRSRPTAKQIKSLIRTWREHHAL